MTQTPLERLGQPALVCRCNELLQENEKLKRQVDLLQQANRRLDASLNAAEKHIHTHTGIPPIEQEHCQWTHSSSST